ncbi:acyl-CoA dehydrogenase family protein [Halalkalibacter urbisdiaboli]|uniref:acyl-CoA dehydrogenase family protein n=1 Tax=Halalkalibacter urbisdiaboli TaxID=1960589 RepID=UPI000B43B289|nr:acyl-CoA dehydrogenase family protein [Halalkalibacter urbisdiaboli]
MNSPSLLKLDSTEERIQLLRKKSKPFFNRAEKHDRNGTFPKENIADLKAIDYHALTIPKKYGGKEISLYEMVRLQETIAEFDGATSLSIGWHLGIIKNLSERRNWDEDTYAELCKEVVKKGALINAAATEPDTGSPTRGGRPTTIARKVGNEWSITGRKTFTTMSPVLDFFLVSASIDKTEQVGNFLIPRTSEGLTIDETWDMMAMRATGSHDLVLNSVRVNDSRLVEYLTPGEKPAAGWLLHIPACYLGIAKGAQAYAIQFAKSYSPNSIEGTISDLPNVKQKIGEIELLLQQSSHFLYAISKAWDESDEQQRQQMKPELGAVKHCVTNQAIKAVDLAMRIVGAHSLSNERPLQRYYRDVRAGLHNPPMDDMTIMMLAATAMNRM